jgi:hypothetical protein
MVLRSVKNDGVRSIPPVFVRDGTLLPSSGYADARYIDAVVVSQANVGNPNLPGIQLPASRDHLPLALLRRTVQHIEDLP